jgi:hypothetical protein
MIKIAQLFALVLWLGTDVLSAASGDEFYFGSWSAGDDAGTFSIGDMRSRQTQIPYLPDKNAASGGGLAAATCCQVRKPQRTLRSTSLIAA